jgi:hypothetical protein
LENGRITAPVKSARSFGRLTTAAIFVAAVALASSWVVLPAGAVDGEPSTLAVLPFEILDTSGEVGSPDRHDAMLASLTRMVGERIEAAHLYKVVPQAIVAKAVAAANPGTYLRDCNGCELDIGRSAGANEVLIGWIYKVSSLILTLHIEIKDVASGQTTYARVFDFRGDNEKAWQRAAQYMVNTFPKAGSRAAPPAVGQ